MNQMLAVLMATAEGSNRLKEWGARPLADMAQRTLPPSPPGRGLQPRLPAVSVEVITVTALLLLGSAAFALFA